MAIINSLGQLVGTGALNGSFSGTPAPQYQTQSNQILNVASMAQYKPTDYTRQADGSVILNAGVTPIAGTYKPAPTIPAQLPAADLTNNNPIVPATNSTSAYDEAYAKGLGLGQAQALKDLQAQQEAQKATDQSTLSASEKAFNDLVAQIGGKGKAQADLQTSLGVNTMTTQLADVNAQLAAKTGEFNSLIEQNRGKAINSRIIGGTEDKLVRQKGIETGTLSSIAQAIQGNISTAKQTAEDTIAFQYAPLEQELELKKMQLERAYDTFDASEKKRADDLLATIDAQKEQVTAEKAVRSKINDVMISASKNGADAETLKQIMASKDESGAILAAGSFLAPSDFAVNTKTGQLYNKKTGETVGASVAKSVSGSSSGGAKGVGATAPNAPTSSFSDAAINYAKDILAGRINITAVPSKIRDEVINAKASLEATEKPLADKLQAQGLSDKIAQIDEVLSSKGMSGTVGAYGITRWTPFSPDKADRLDFIASVEQLINQETIDKLVQSKAAGATYGALSEGERAMLAQSASRIGSWKIFDNKGNVTGYKISEELFKKELNKIKDLAQRAKDRITADSVIAPPSQVLSDNAAWDEYQKIKSQ